MILHLVIFLCLTISTLGTHVRIIGGRNADIINYPYIVALKRIRNKHQFCSGIIISRRHILTAAHCFDKYAYDTVKAYVGSNIRTSPGPSYRFLEINIHPKYTAKLTRKSCLINDIAVATVDGCIVFNKFINKINLPFKNVQPGTGSKVAGWGITSYPSGFPPDILQEASMTILSNQMCSIKISHSINAGQICAFARLGVGVCTGDSGGPLVSDDGELVGIASFCILCALDKPDVYTRVFYYLEFIKEILNTSHFPTCVIS